MKSILLIGLGRFGLSIAEKLNELNYQVMAVDRDEKRVNAVLDQVTDAQVGDSTNEAFLHTLGVDNFDLCFVGIGEDFQSSLETTALLKELGAKTVIARASSDIHKRLLLRSGADDVVYPEKQLADWAVLRYVVDRVQDFIALDAEYAIYEITVPEEWNGHALSDLDIRRKYDINILAVRTSGGRSHPVSADTVFTAAQSVLVLGKWKDIQKCFRV